MEGNYVDEGSRPAVVITSLGATSPVRGRSFGALVMRALLVTCCLVVLLALLPGCDAEPTPIAVTAPQSIVDALTATQPSGFPPSLPYDYNNMGDKPRGDGDFDASAYLAALPKLAMEPGFVLDYFFQYNGMGGEPYLYARPADRAPYASLDEYVKANPVQERIRAQEYLGHIKIDDTPAGYFQWVTLMVMGGQFYLDWHALYNDTTLLCDGNALERLMKTAGWTFQQEGLPTSLPLDVQKEARKLDLTPTVTFPDAYTAIVRIVTFSKWGGFNETRYTIGRQFPHKLLKTETLTLVKYDCGVMF
jgi:hypothetical protein